MVRCSPLAKIIAMLTLPCEALTLQAAVVHLIHRSLMMEEAFTTMGQLLLRNAISMAILLLAKVVEFRTKEWPP